MTVPPGGRVVLITGAGAGIGNALARRFRDDGDLVVGCDVGGCVEAAVEACDLATDADVRDPSALASLVEEATARFGRVDALVANAGMARQAPIADGRWEDLLEVLEVNIHGVLHSIRAVLPGMTDRGHGRIIPVVSRNAELCPPALGGYSASKAAVTTLTRTLSRELKGTGVLVNNLIPGPSRTPMNPDGTLAPDACYPTARMLVDLPDGGPSGRTFLNGEEYPMWSRFSQSRRPVS